MTTENYNLHTSKNSAFYRFVSTYQGYMNATRDYGDGVMRNMSEMHILQIVCHEPGITVGQVAQQWGKTKGAASQNITKLEKQGLVVRAKHAMNAKEIHVYPTQEGQKLTELHEQYDKKTEAKFARALLSRCTVDELKIFTKLLDIYSDLMDEELVDQNF